MPRTFDQVLEARLATASVAIDSDSIERAGRIHLTVRKIVRLVIQAIVFSCLVSVFFFRVPQVEGRSMQPSIESGNHVLINTLSYGIALGPLILSSTPITRGDIIAFERGRGDDARIFLKRVIALPGETVAISNGVVRVQGERLNQPYHIIPDSSNMSAASVPSGTVFVLGDNRGESDDSRSFGPIPQSSIVGKALFVIWPLGHVKRIQ